jgi:hypothetical protein
MVFTKTAQKFGQWSDPKAGTIYGVGFLNEDDLSKVGDDFGAEHFVFLHLHKYYTFHLCNPFVSCDFIANICKI